MLLSEDSALSEFMKRLRHAPSAALLLDYDGTLAPFHEDRLHARPYCGIVSLLERIADSGKTRLAVISGRPVAELKSLLAPLRVEMWGAAGMERLMPDGSRGESAICRKTLELLSQAKEKVIEAGLISMAEIKPGGIAMHWRGMPAAKAESAATLIRELWKPFADAYFLRLLEFDQGVELRVARPDKGDAVRTIVEEVGTEAQIAYLGDDFTDEDAFRALNGRGLSVLVRPDFRETLAQAWLRPPEELTAFLRTWLTQRS
jgi:trehalose 6-phosphate phosphatase